MVEPLSELRFEYKVDLPSESYQCYQVMDGKKGKKLNRETQSRFVGSIFYLSNSTPAQLFVVLNEWVFLFFNQISIQFVAELE